MRLKLLYTVVCILCLSAFASSKNECTHPVRDASAAQQQSTAKELSKEITEEKPEFSTLQFVKMLYL